MTFNEAVHAVIVAGPESSEYNDAFRLLIRSSEFCRLIQAADVEFKRENRLKMLISIAAIGVTAARMVQDTRADEVPPSSSIHAVTFAEALRQVALKDQNGEDAENQKRVLDEMQRHQGFMLATVLVLTAASRDRDPVPTLAHLNSTYRAGILVGRDQAMVEMLGGASDAKAKE